MRPLAVCIFGAAPDTGNMGVSALGRSVVCALHRREPTMAITLFDHGRGCRDDVFRTADGPVPFERRGAVHSRRWHRPEAWMNMRVSAALGGVLNGGTRRVLEADAVLDLSGGDSFTDLYGPRRLTAMLMPKRLALANGVPLILLPQTYGPFRDDSVREEAGGIVRRAVLAFARDRRSHDDLRALAGDGFDPMQHRTGVDVAFLLEPHPDVTSPAEGAGQPAVGINVSGLLFREPAAARARFGIRGRYDHAMQALVQRFARRSDARVLLVPHVLTDPDHHESDIGACRALHDALPRRDRDRVRVLETEPDPTRLKAVIGGLDWFCGARLHSCIAALGSGVPVAGVAYSRKMRGVFETCGQGDAVADARALGTDALVDRLWTSWCGRAVARRRLRTVLPDVRIRAEAQMDQVAHAIRANNIIVPARRSA